MDYFKGFTTDLICLAVMMAATMLSVVMLGAPSAARYAVVTLAIAGAAFFSSAVFNLLADRGIVLRYLQIFVAVCALCAGVFALITIGKALWP